MKKFKNLKFLLIFVGIFIFFFLVKYNLLNRFYLDSIFLVLFFLLNMNIKQNIILFLVLFTYTLVFNLSNQFLIGVVNLSILPIFMLALKNRLIEKKFFENTLTFSIIYCGFMVAIDYLMGNYVEAGDRISGPFTSSLHVSYFIVISAVYISTSKIKYKNLLICILLFSAVLSGSRVSFLGVLMSSFYPIFKNYNTKFKITALLILCSIIYFVLLLELRSISYHPEAEALRIQGWVNFYNYLITSDLFTIFIGNGRNNYGALGYRLIGDSAFITESSFIMLIYSYGAILGGILSLFIIYKIYSLRSLKIVNLMVITFFLFTPFFDSPAILILNSYILNQLVEQND